MQLKYLKNIQTPKDIRDYNIEQLRELCDEIRNYTIDTVTSVGGHFNIAGYKFLSDKIINKLKE